MALLQTHAELLAELAVDLLIFEMLSTRAEVEAAARIIDHLSARVPEMPVAVGFTCGEAGRTHGGVSMTEAARILEAARPRLWFIQCTRHDRVERPLRELGAQLGSARSIGVYANDGREWRDQRWHGERVSPAHYAEVARGWAELGVAVIGGCCGTGPDHVAALSRLRGG